MAAERVKRVAIVGGGFAGVVTALELLKGPHAREYEITVLERADSPYTTLCGEGLSLDTLNELPPFEWRKHVAEEFPGAMWAFPGGVRVLVNQPCFSMARESWIPAMADAAMDAGAEYRTGVKVTPQDVSRLSKEFDVVIGADGPGSQVRKFVGGGHETMLGLQYRVDAASADYVTDRLEFFTDKRFSPEYSWVFPRGDLLNVGLLSDEGLGMDANWKRLDAFMKHVGLNDVKVTKREAYPIGFFGTRVARGNVLLVGDAAGLTNPVTKGGMAAVVYAARILADSLAKGAPFDYESRIFKHPLTSPDFRKAVAIIHRWTNADFERLARFAPPTMTVGADADAGPAGANGTPRGADAWLEKLGLQDGSARRRYLGPMLLAMLANPGKLRDLNTLARAMGLARRYSW